MTGEAVLGCSGVAAAIVFYAGRDTFLKGVARLPPQLLAGGGGIEVGHKKALGVIRIDADLSPGEAPGYHLHYLTGRLSLTAQAEGEGGGAGDAGRQEHGSGHIIHIYQVGRPVATGSAGGAPPD